MHPCLYSEARLAPDSGVTHLHAAKAFDLPLHHQDPFDRLIIAQAIVEGMTTLTADRAFGKYPVDIVWCGK